jgi:hypothetical protein
MTARDEGSLRHAASWKKHLSAEQTQRVTETVAALGLVEFFSDCE